MRFYELTEDINVLAGDRDSQYEAAYTILENCEPFISQVSDPLSLFRGMGAQIIKFGEKKIRTNNRKPVQMRENWHNMLNIYFQQEFGAPFRNSMLATGSRSVASTFGIQHMVFPM